MLTSGFNRVNDVHDHRVGADSNEYVFVFDIRHGPLQQKQALQVPNTFFGIAFAPDGHRFYVSGGVDDNIHVFAQANGAWVEDGAPILLGHKEGVGLQQKPTVANLAITGDGKTLVAANIYSDSIVGRSRDAPQSR